MAITVHIQLQITQIKVYSKFKNVYNVKVKNLARIWQINYKSVIKPKWSYQQNPTLDVSPTFIGCLEWFTNTKSKYSCIVGTAGLCSFAVLLLLFHHQSSQHMYTVLEPYISYLLKNNRFQAQNQCLNQRPQVLRGIWIFERAWIPIFSGSGWWEAASKALSCEGPARL